MKKILLVDDKAENLYLMQTILGDDDFITITARNGAEALGLIRIENPDLIISDILMPVMDGFALCRECKKDELLKNIPFFFYTATYTDSRDEQFAMSLGADRFILKPKDPDEFLLILNDFFKNAKKKKNPVKEPDQAPEAVVLKEYNEVLIRKLESKMLQSEKTEKELRIYAEKLEKEIQKREVIEKSLRESQLLFRTLAEGAPVGIFKTDLKGETTYVNPKWCELSGMSQSDALGRGWMKAVHPDDRKSLHAKWNADLAEGLESTAEYRFLKSDKSIVWVLGKAVPEVVDNSVVGYVGTITDITKRKLSEDKVKSSEERLKIVFDYAPDAYYLCDLKGQFIDGNIAAERVLGYNKNELIGKNFLKLKLLSVKDIARAAKLLTKNSLGHSTGPDTFTISRKDGSTFSAEITTHPVRIEGKMLVLGIARDISERLRSEEALIESESKYRYLVTNSPDGIFIVDLSGKFLSVNKSICETLGYTEEELKSISLLDIVPQKYHAVHLQRLGLLMKGEMNSSAAEYEVIGKNGVSYFVEVLSVPYFSNKRIIGFQGIARNITERKTMEDQLRESEKRFRSYFNISVAGIAITSPDAEWIEVNNQICEMLGYERDELLKTKWIDLTHPEDLEIDLEQFQMVLSGEIESYNIDKRFIKKNGQIIWTSLAVNCLRNSDRSVRYFIAVMIDITSRKIAEEALKRSQYLVTNALKIAKMGAWEYDVEKDIFTFSDLFYEIYHTSAEYEGGYNMSSSDYAQKFVHPDDIYLVGKAIKDAMETTDPNYSPQIGHRIILRDGGTGYVNVRFSVIKDGSGKTIRTIGVNQNITEQKRIEKELIDSKEKAEESDRLKTAFLHNISHEIRTPMNAITGFTALLTEPGIDDVTRNSFIETITQSSDQLLNIINDILEISNIEAGTIKLSKIKVEINSVIKNLYNQFVPKAAEKNLKLSHSLSLTDQEAIVVTDKTKLIQIISNLLNNAFKFTKKGQITFGYDLISDHLRFYIADTGIGISEDDLDRIFDRFYQVDHGFERQSEGTGLGLSICKAYTLLLGGDIWVSSEPGVGSTFFFTIPFRKDIDPAISIESKNIENDLVFNGEKTIIVAEDIDSNFKLIDYFLRNTNAVILRAKNGKEAVDLALSGRKIDLILMDLKMPEMDGFEAANIIHTSKPEIPIVAQSAYTEEKSRILKAGYSGFITKPFDKKKLIESISELMK